MKQITTVLLALCAFAHAFPAHGQGSTRLITTIAGTGNDGHSQRGKADTCKIGVPEAMARDSKGNLFLPDANNGFILKVNRNGFLTTIAGTGIPGPLGDGGPATAAYLASPLGIALDDNGDIYLSDGLLHTIRKIRASDGIITTIAGTGTRGFSGDGGPAAHAMLNEPCGLCIHAGKLYIADWGNNRVRVIDLMTNIIRTFAGTGTVGYSGNYGPATAAEFNRPIEVTAGNDGGIYIGDQYNGVVWKVKNGFIRSIVGNGTTAYSGDGGPATAAQVGWPSGISIYQDTLLYIADCPFGAIRMINLRSGIITTVAGGKFGYSGDGGLATNAELVCSDICLDNTGRMYIADYTNSRVRMVWDTSAQPPPEPVLPAPDGQAVSQQLIRTPPDPLVIGIYPNPTRGRVTINLPNTPPGDYVICDLSGKIYQSGTFDAYPLNLDVSALPSGIYFFWCGARAERILKE